MSVSPRSEAIAQQAMTLLRSWGYEDWKVGHVDGPLPMRYLEHLIHEMAHAASLGFRFRKETPRFVDTHLHGRGRKFSDAQEAKTLAIGWHVWRQLELPYGNEHLIKITAEQCLEISDLFGVPNRTCKSLARQMCTVLYRWSGEEPCLSALWDELVLER